MSTSTDVAVERPRDLRTRPTPPHGRLAVWSPTTFVALATLAIGVSGLRGADYPAHFFRALLWERSGPAVWDNLWYAGHATPTYSLLAPALMAWIGPFAVVAVGAIVATYCFTRLTVDLLPSSTTSAANHVFAAVVLVNVIVGRAPFALGLALALLAVLAWSRAWIVIAVVAAALTALISPVAAVFLAIAATSVALAGVRRGSSVADRTIVFQAVSIAVATSAPLVVTSALFGESGRFPFPGGSFVLSVLTLSLVAVAIPNRAVRFTAAVGAATAGVVFLVPNPMGANFVRLAQIVAVPLVVTAVPSVRRALRVPVVLFIVVGLGWSLRPGVVAAIRQRGDPSLAAIYHQPLIEQVRTRNLDGRAVGRLEIPFTENHWETFYVAAEVPFARGWERQVDVARNPQLYDPALTVDQYHAWLLENGVRWIAVADVALDPSGANERRLIDGRSAHRIPWLSPVWSNEHWRLFEVVDYVPIVDPPAQLVEQDPDSLLVSSPRPATVTIRYRYDEHQTISGSACVEPDGAGWTVAHLPAAGLYRLTVDRAASWMHAAEAGCP